MKNWTIYLIHHSHTDIGYTERQEKLMRYHRDFILQAIDILDGIHSGKICGCDGFKWQCENQWQIENFYSAATKEQTEKFERYAKSGEIGLSGNYLNLTELIDREVLLSRTIKAKKYGDKIGVKVKSGMSADINGYAWGYPDVLSECGVENLFGALHPHHGMFPLYKKQKPFYWQGPKGNKVLVWGGEHYHMGNEMFLCPHGGTSYMVLDDIREELSGNTVRTASPEATEKKELEIACIRIKRYVENLEREGYEYDFFPLMVSGVITDNAPPNANIAQRVNKLNEIFGGKVTIKMAILDEFFDKVRSSSVPVPTYEGDFTDWWADGVGSTPNAVKIYRDAQRKYDLCQKLDPNNELGDAGLIERAAENIILYSEHTWGYSSSISEPWDSMVACLEKKKDAYAINANTEISQNLDLVLSKLGEVSIDSQKCQRYKVINPHKLRYNGTVKLCIEYWEYLDGNSLNPIAKIEAFDENTGEKLICQGHRISRAYEVEVAVDLAPGEEKTIKLYQSFENSYTIKNHAHIGAERVKDIVTEKEYLETPFLIETDFIKVEFSKEKGVASIFDKRSGRVITDGSVDEGAFSGIYEFTPIKDNPCEVRRQMGRNRCSMATERSVSTVSDISIIESGDVFVTAKLSYKLPGTRYYSVFLKVYKVAPIIEARVCLHKESVWDPENLYVSLPFVADSDGETFVDKTGCIIRPGIDQLPGTCQNFYLIQNGIVKTGRENDIIIGTKDTPLVSFGKREAAPIELCSCDNIALNRSTPYSWVMNNFWETNFKADLGGFYEFTYTVVTAGHESAEAAMEYCKAVNEGVLGFYI